MATIVAFFTVHEKGCWLSRPSPLGTCKCEEAMLIVQADFTPGSTVKDSIGHARAAARYVADKAMKAS